MTRISAFFCIEAKWTFEALGKTRKCVLEWLMYGWKLLKRDEKEAYEKAMRDSKDKADSPMGSAGKVVKEVDLMQMLHGQKEKKKPQTLEEIRAKLPSKEKLAEMRAAQIRKWGM